MFYDRVEAGEQLVTKLYQFQGKSNTIILALARGGVIVADVVARELNLSLEVIVIKKIGAPGDPELAIGAIAESGEPIINEEMIGTYGITPDYLDKEVSRIQEEIKQRVKLYRGNHSLPNLEGKNIILVDDGIATGRTIEAAVSFVESQKAKKIIVVTPVIAKDSLEQLKNKFDELYYIDSPEIFFAVSQFYEEFPQVTDEEIRRILDVSK